MTTSGSDPLAPPPGTGGRHEDALALARRVPNAIDPLQAIMGCPPPVWMNTGERKHEDGICVYYSGTRRCEKPATHWAWIGCTTGEHLDKSGTCEAHMLQVANLALLNCLRCWEALRILSKAHLIKTELIRSGDTSEGDDA
jgi:hypothetical protein